MVIAVCDRCGAAFKTVYGRADLMMVMAGRYNLKDLCDDCKQKKGINNICDMKGVVGI